MIYVCLHTLQQLYIYNNIHFMFYVNLLVDCKKKNGRLKRTVYSPVHKYNGNVNIIYNGKLFF